MKKRILIFTGLSLLVLFMAFYTYDIARKPRLVTITDLIYAPEKYDGKSIQTEGIYVSSFEVSALGRLTYKQGDSLFLTEPTIWIESTTIETKSDCFTTGFYDIAEFCVVTVHGIFEYGEGYGHMGQYKYQIREE